MLTPAEEMELISLAEWDLWSRDPWQWIKDCCYTMDEADEGKTKRFPDKEYLSYICTAWLKHDLLAIPKTRRMMLSWLMIALHLWAALFHPNSAIFVQSKKQEDSDFLIADKRMMFIYNNLPKTHRWPVCAYKSCNIAVSNGSYIKAIGQGADQLRGYTASYIMLDECAFWEQAEDTWAALKPTVQGGGRVVLVSSAGPGFYQRICEGDI
jgi:hypothetical protein